MKIDELLDCSAARHPRARAVAMADGGRCMHACSRRLQPFFAKSTRQSVIRRTVRDRFRRSDRSSDAMFPK